MVGSCSGMVSGPASWYTGPGPSIDSKGSDDSLEAGREPLHPIQIDEATAEDRPDQIGSPGAGPDKTVGGVGLYQS